MTTAWAIPASDHPLSRSDRGRDAHRHLKAFYGIVIALFYGDQAPRHFHAPYGEFAARVDIRTLALLAESGLPRRAERMVTEWGALHRAELMCDWEKAQNGEVPDRSEPLP